MLASKEDRARWLKVKTTPGNVILKEKCQFHGFSVIAGKIDNIRDAYMKLKHQFGHARHIVCAYRLPGKNFAAMSDFVDDGEHGMGQTLLKMLCDAQIFNRAVFVIRYYGGEHLGPSRYQAYLDAAQSAIIHDPYNHICKINQTPWPKEANEIPPTPSVGNPQPISQSQTKASNPTSSAATPSVLGAMVTNDQPQETTENRGRLPSGPVRPLTYLYNSHATSDPEWDNYYKNNYQNTTGQSWADQTLNVNANDTASVLGITSDITQLTSSLTVK